MWRGRCGEGGVEKGVWRGGCGERGVERVCGGCGEVCVWRGVCEEKSVEREALHSTINLS